ncbi:hypothetical protein FA13DRAFT_1725628 [Coprinellus micaceus]|uniref:Uncharacterized protein n=1 Tax=Coprinellus micaceus TaxID=71717 RepID=A0A4Y7TV08_COPMI|nr:hypothetical protein FA13DRAFT_1725628 [Coprinellus micaceus]
MFRNFANQLINGTGAQLGANDGSSSGDKTSMAPTLRSDVYNAIDGAKAWLAGGQGRGQAGDGVSYQSLLTLIQKHFPNTQLGLDAVGQLESEVAVIVGGVTNMVLEVSKWEGMAGAMAMGTWVDALVDGHRGVVGAKLRKDTIADGIIKGLNYNTDTRLMTKEFTAKIQIISTLKSVSARIYGAGTDEARKSEALWSSKFM